MFTTLAFLFVSFNMNAQSNISLSDFKNLDNTSWEGNLTYKNYQDGKLISIPTKMQIKVTDVAIEQTLQYTYEPDKNISSKTKIKKNGRYLGKQEVIEKIMNPDSSFKIVTKYEGKDDNKKATLYITYELNSNSYSVTKEVQFNNANERFVRHQYKFIKK